MQIRCVISQGKNKIVAFAEKYVRENNQLINQIVLIGQHRKWLAALVRPNLEAIATWAKTQGLQHLTQTELLAHPKTRTLIKEELKAKMRSRSLPDYLPVDDITDFWFVLEDFTKAPPGRVWGVGCWVLGKPALEIGLKPPLSRGRKKRCVLRRSARSRSVPVGLKTRRLWSETPLLREESLHPTPYPLHPVHTKKRLYYPNPKNPARQDRTAAQVLRILD